MKILITGGCGFVGSNLAIYLKKALSKSKIYSLDNLSRKGSKLSHKRLRKHKIKNFKFNIEDYKSFKRLPRFDLIIDCCAEAAVEVSKVQIDRVINTNLIGTFNVLKKCSKDKSNLIFLSSSRVYSIENLNKKIVNENFDTIKPKSIYGFSKLSSELLIREFSYLFKIKYIINRLGVISGPWQYGKEQQGFVSLWVWRHLTKGRLSYNGYGGKGRQIRDVVHIADVCRLVQSQISKFKKINNILVNAGGGKKNSISLKGLTKICQEITSNKLKITSKKKTSIYDIPYYVTNNSLVKKIYRWEPKKNIYEIVRDIYLWMKLNKKEIKKYIK